MFSSRVPGDLKPNRLARAVARARDAGRPIVDLTVTNPTRACFDYPPTLLAALAAPPALVYEPHPRGSSEARTAVSADYARQGTTIAPDRILLTASTSEAYSLLFKLLCDPGDAVLVPAPSYPLFDHLTALDAVRAVPYRLEYHGRWHVDVESVDAAWSGDVRAVLGVSPNNPTGSMLTRAEVDALALRCAAGSAALILDEVFADYPFVEDGVSRPGDLPCLTFRLGGLSKSAGLPQVKLGWMAVSGPDRLVAEAVHRLELIADTYLSVSTPVQVAASALIRRGASVRAQILARVRANYAALRERAASHPAAEVLNADGGWAAVVRMPSTVPEEELVLSLLDADGVLVHPGYFFDFPHETFVVVSLLAPPDAFAAGVRALLELRNSCRAGLLPRSPEPARAARGHG